jgi:uncharacterized protein (TIGR02246 family)
MVIRVVAAAAMMLSVVSYGRAVQELRPTEEAAIRRRLVGYAEARSRWDAAAEAMYFTEDGELRFADGRKVNGRKQIEQALRPATPPNPRIQAWLRIDAVRFVTNDVVVADGIASPSGNYATYVMVKRENIWFIDVARIALAPTVK